MRGTGVGELAAVTGNCLVEIVNSEGYNFSDDDTCGFDDPTDDVAPGNDPELLPFVVRHWLGAALVQAKRFSEAERVYREDLARHPHNGWALTGLQQALRGQGKLTREVDEESRASWSRADIKISASRF